MDSIRAASPSSSKGPQRHARLRPAGARKALIYVFDLVRDDIPHPSVDLAFLIRPNIGYIHVANFSSETTSREVGDALDQVPGFAASSRASFIKLRGNPGGLDEAVSLSDKFLQKG